MNKTCAISTCGRAFVSEDKGAVDAITNLSKTWDKIPLSDVQQLLHASSKKSPKIRTLLPPRPPEFDHLWGVIDRNDFARVFSEQLRERQSPRIVHGVVDRLFFVCFDRNTKLYCLRIRFGERVRFFRDVPVDPAKEMLNHAN